MMISNDKIKSLREQRDWTQEEMAEKLGLTRNGYAKIERGESLPSLERLDEIAKIFDVNVVELLNLNEKNVIFQTQNQEVNYYQQSIHNENLQNEIDKLELVVSHLKELLQQKDNEIQALKDLVQMYKKHQS